MLEEWRPRSIVPSNHAAISRVQDHVRSQFDDERAIVLEIRFDDRSASLRDLAAYLMLIDGAFGRTDPRGFRSYSLRSRDHLSIDRLQSGSAILELLFVELGGIELWRFIVAYLVLKKGPSMLKEWADAAKTAGEAVSVWWDVGARVYSAGSRALLRRRRYSAIRKLAEADPLFEGLARPDADELVRLVDEVLVALGSRLSAAIRFDDAHVIEVAFRIRRRRSSGDAGDSSDG